MRKLILPLAFLLSSVCFAQSDFPAGWIPVVNAKNQFAKLNQYDATQYCSQMNMHLPSAREWSDLALKQGARRLEFSQFSDHKNEINCITYCYNSVTAKNFDSSLDIFAIYPWSYRESSTAMTEYFWSSSLSLKPGDKFAYYFNGYSGDIFYVSKRDSKKAVVCAPESQIKP